jgi:hypothetical protein
VSLLLLRTLLRQQLLDEGWVLLHQELLLLVHQLRATCTGQHTITHDYFTMLYSSDIRSGSMALAKHGPHIDASRTLFARRFLAAGTGGLSMVL